MSDERHEFSLNSIWTENSDGDGSIHFVWGGELPYGIPAGTGGKPGRSNPEEMLVASVAACYSITLAMLYERKRLPVPKIEVSAEGVMVRNPDRTLRFTEITLKPVIYPGDVAPENDGALKTMAEKAEKYCVISNALRGNVEIHVVPTVVR